MAAKQNIPVNECLGDEVRTRVSFPRDWWLKREHCKGKKNETDTKWATYSQSPADKSVTDKLAS